MSDRGFIESERLPSRRVRYRIVFREGGRKIRVATHLCGGGLVGPFTSHEEAQRVLDGIRVHLAQGFTLRRSIAKFLPTDSPEDLVRNRLAEYLEHFEALVEQGQRSPTTLCEIKRYAEDGGHFSYWLDRGACDIANGEVEDWHKWLGRRGIGPKTQKNVSDAFRAFLRRLRWRGEVDRVPDFPPIEVPEYAPRIITLEQQARILGAVPWERRGAFLVAATEALRLSEIRALDLTDYRDGRLNCSKAQQGHRFDARTAHTKNRSAIWREPWHPELVRWIEWRLELATPERRLAGEVALFWNPTARNVAKRWTPNPMEEEWRRACVKVGEDVPFGEGTRHCILTTLGEELPERMLQAFSRHRDGKSLGRYAKPRPQKAVIRKITRTKGGPTLAPRPLLDKKR